MPKPVEAMHFSKQSLLISKDYENETIRNVKVSWYGEAICRGRKFCRTANGQEFKWWEDTAACWSDYPFGSKFLVKFNDRSVLVTCSDRGRFQEMDRFLDLSSGAFSKIAPLSKGILTVDVEIIK